MHIKLSYSELYGRCLVLDDAIQCTEKDEFSYQEMITFLPLNSHERPQNVLIIGGGDGGVAREAVKHPLVEKIVMCELDEEVVQVSQRYLPFMAKGFDNPKLDLHFEDGYEYVKKNKNKFDVIITDSSDPNGPAECLFQKPYYQALYEALRPGGIICCQGESYWLDLKFIKGLVSTCKGIYKTVSYASISVPSYPGGQIGFLICCKDKEIDFSKPKHEYSIDELDLKFYSKQTHESAFVLPNFVKKVCNLTKLLFQLIKIIQKVICFHFILQELDQA